MLGFDHKHRILAVSPLYPGVFSDPKLLDKVHTDTLGKMSHISVTNTFTHKKMLDVLNQFPNH